MEAATLWISFFAMAGGLASAVIAWVARADALRAGDSAEKAHAAAVQAWERAAGALEEANALQVRLTTEATERDGMAERTRISQRIFRIYLEAFLRGASGSSSTPAERADKREAVIALAGTGEPGAMQLGLLLELELNSVPSGDADGASRASAKAAKWADSWAQNPEAFAEEHRDLMSVEFLSDALKDVMNRFDTPRAASRDDSQE